MASVQKRPNGKWRARYRDADGKEHARHFQRKIDAQRWLDEVTADVLTGRWVDPRRGKVLFRDWFGIYAERQIWSRSTRLSAEQALLSATFADVPIGRITNAHIQDWIKGMTLSGAQKKTGLAPATIETRYGLLRQAFKQAVRDRMIPEDPTDGVKLPRQRRRAAAMTVPSVEQVRDALGAAPGWFRAYIAVCAFAGLRLGEAAGLQVGDVDFLRRTISVRRQVQGENNRVLEVVTPKHESERVIYIPGRLAEMLAAHVQEFGVRGDEQWLFFANGNLLNRGSAGYYWRETRELVGMEEFTLHDLRHFYASALIADGCDVVTVQRALGHSLPSITLNTYSHLWPTAEDKTRTAALGLMAAVLDDDADSARTGAYAALAD